MSRAGAALALVTLTLWMQSVGMAGLIAWGRTLFSARIEKFGPRHSMRLMVRLTATMIALHLLEIAVWAGFYRWRCLPGWAMAFDFSAGSYSTGGTAGIVLPPMWRFLGPMESLTGVLMCGLSVGLLFAIVTRLVGREIDLPSVPGKPGK
jgi:hypothetical protein